MKTIMVIDNDPEVQEYYSDLLIVEGYRILNCYTGEDGLKKIKKFKPDTLILDMELGSGMSGRDIVLELKKIDKKLPVLVISGKVGMDNDPELLISPNIYRFFTKPISLSVLLETIRKILPDKPREDANKSKVVKNVQKIAGYTLEELVGRGGCGEVYKATHLEKLVAIKVLHEDTLTAEDIQRFKREAVNLASVQHPAIIHLLDTGQKDGLFFIAMEFFEGQNLEQLLAKKLCTKEIDAVQIIKDVASGLQAAHSIGIIHRDVKPSNIIYNSKKQQVKIVDFGLARKHRANQTITQELCALGTPLYMSPEQCMGQKLDLRSDIYNLGATFYHMVTGTIPFNMADVIQTMYAHVCNDLEWPLQSPIDVNLKKIIEKMMAKKPQDRHQSMQEIVTELDNL